MAGHGMIIRTPRHIVNPPPEPVPDMHQRFLRIMRRHLRQEDASLSDTDFIRKVMERFEYDRRQPIIDVNE